MSGKEAAERPATLEVLGGLSCDAIRDELNRILTHREFQATDKMRRFLRFVVEEALAGRADRLKGYRVAIEVFGRAKDFDAAQDPIVRIQAGRLRQALERYYLVAGGRDPIHIHIPKGHYIPHFAAQAVEIDAPLPGASVSGGVEPRTPVGPSVAVLPLENLTADPEQRYFAAGLAEDLITELSRFQDMVVISCQRATRTAGLPADPEQLGKAAGARFMLGGAVRRDRQMVKVSMHLTDVASSRGIWAKAYKHPLEAGRLIATQEEIARNVVAATASDYGIIARRLAAESRKKAPAELSTYEALLRYYSRPPQTSSHPLP